MKLKKNDLVKHESGAVVTVLKAYMNEAGKEYVHVFNETGMFWDRVENFIPMGCLLLRCNSCDEEKYEVELNVKDNGMYECSCGSSTFTSLNIDLENYNY